MLELGLVGVQAPSLVPKFSTRVSMIVGAQVQVLVGINLREARLVVLMDFEVRRYYRC